MAGVIIVGRIGIGAGVLSDFWFDLLRGSGERKCMRFIHLHSSRVN